MNANSFRSEMESESDLEERGFGGVRITDEVLAFARKSGCIQRRGWIFRLMKKKTWTVCAFFFFFWIQISNQKVNA